MTYTLEYSDEAGNRATVAHDTLDSVVAAIATMGDTDAAIGFNGENLTCNNVPEQWTDSEYGYEYVTVCGQYPHRSGDPERITLFTIVVTRPTPVSDTLPTCDTCGQCGTVPHSDGIVAEFDKYFPACDTCGQWCEACMCILDAVATCPVCGEPIDWCTGHGDLGDPRGYAILAAHDADDHTRCHWRSDCAPRNYWGTPKADVSDDHCPLCERENPNHYSVCPNHRS